MLQPQRFAKDLRDVFGWCRVVRDDDVSCREQLALLEAADAIERTDDGWRSRVRFSTSGELIVAHSASRFVVFFLATVLNAVIFMGLYELLGLRHFGTPFGAVAGQGVGNAVVGVLVFKVVELLPGAVERRRAARSAIRR